MKKQSSFNKSLTRPVMNKTDEVKFDDSIIDVIFLSFFFFFFFKNIIYKIIIYILL